MNDGDRPPVVALAGWGVGAWDLLPHRTRTRIEAARTILVDGADAFASPALGSVRRAPDDAESCASVLRDADTSGEPTVWLTAGDPLTSERGRRIAQILTAWGVDWEYLPALDATIVERAGAVAHLAREAVARDAEEWRRWRARFPLLGLTVAVTRAEHQADALVAPLAARGADTIACPTIEIVDPDETESLDRALEHLDTFDWAIFTSANGVTRFFSRMQGQRVDIRELKGVRIAAIGPATASEIERRGLTVDVVPGEYVAEGLFESLVSYGPLESKRFLIARAAVARDVLPEALREAGAIVEVVEAYRTVRPESSRPLIGALLERPRQALVTFTSSSTVGNFVHLAEGRDPTTIRAACIGPITAATARAAGLEVVVEAADYTIDGLVAAIEDWYG